jgi:hypothetical protein
MTVFADSATLDLPCAIGRIPDAIVADADGTFDLPGEYAIQAGPIGVNGAMWQPARFGGNRTDDVVTMTIVVSDSTSVGPLKFHRDTVGSFARCL